MNFIIDELELILDTNIPQGSEDIEVIRFTIDKLHHPLLKQVNKGLNTYPYFTNDVKYPDILDTFSYEKIIEFFFNKSEFAKTLIQYTTVEKITHEMRNEIEKKNIKTMLILLFPTKYPVYSNVYDSYNYVIKNDKSISKYMLKYANPFVSKNYSYLKQGGNIYTISRIIWINDFLNHPDMVDLFDKYREFLIKIDNDVEEIKNIIDIKRGESSSSTKIPIELRNIESYLQKFVRSKYRYPDFEISNKKLQDYIEKLMNYFQRPKTGSGSKPNEQVTEDELKLLLNIFPLIYNKYYEKKSISDEDAKLLDDILYVGIIKNNNNKRKEVRVLIDLIEGEVNDKNKSTIFCKYNNNKLGNLLTNIYEQQLYGNYSWNLYGNRDFLHSLADNTMKKPSNKTIKKLTPNNETYQINNDSDDNSTNILNKIINNEKLEELLNEYNTSTIGDKPQIDMSSFIKTYINKSIIKNINNSYYNEKNMNNILSQIDSETSKQRKLENKRTEGMNYSEEQRMLQKINKNKLVISILGYLKNIENKKISKGGVNTTPK